MNAKMKVLIGYDGVHPVAGLIRDLQRAGLTQKVEALVVTVVDAFIVPDLDSDEFPTPESTAPYLEAAREEARDRIQKEVEQARKAVKQAAFRFCTAFPQWEVQSEAFADSPAWGIIKKAASWNADLIVVGAHNQSKMSRFFLGSVSQKVVHEASCSVRIVHGEPEETDSPARIVIGADGSPGSELAVQSVAKRVWKKGSAVHLITVVDIPMMTAPAAPDSPADRWIKKQDRKEHAWIHRMTEEFEKKLKPSGLVVSSLVKGGDPKRLLAEAAERWGADSIFVGARGLNGIERLFIGSVSSAIAGRAHCSVEVVRPKLNPEQPHNKYKRRTKSHASS